MEKAEGFGPNNVVFANPRGRTPTPLEQALNEIKGHKMLVGIRMLSQAFGNTIAYVPSATESHQQILKIIKKHGVEDEYATMLRKKISHNQAEIQAAENLLKSLTTR